MKTTQTLLAAVILGTSLFTATQANAALVSALGGQVVNDTDLNITWAANANLAATNTFGLSYGVNYGTDIYGYQSIINSDGSMTWGGAQKWIAAMNTANYLGYNDWRLPTTTDTGKLEPDNRLRRTHWRLPTTTDTGKPGCQQSYNGTDCGYNSTGSEMSHLYYNELGNKALYNTAGVEQSGSGLVNTGTFSNFQTYKYWSGTEYAPNPYGAWVFNTGYGNQVADDKNGNMFAMAVRPGQVAAVPVPAAAWLLGSGLLGLIGVARRRLVIR